MDYPVSHYFLVRAGSARLAGEHVERYLDGNQLITYAEFLFHEEEVLNGADTRFRPTLEHGLAANLTFARRMLAHLKEEGVTSLDQLPTLQQGYATKVLHTLTHLLDGFIGIDSVFYNLIEDGHRVSEALAAAMEATPTAYWLVPIRTGKVSTSILHRVD